MDRIARFVVQKNKVVLALNALITLTALAMWYRMDFNADVNSFILEASPEGRAYAALQQKYQTKDPITVLVEATGKDTFRDVPALKTLLTYRNALAAVEGVETVGSILPEGHPFTGEPFKPEDLDQIPAFAMDFLLSGPAASMMLAENGRATLMAVIAKGDALALVDKVRALPHQQGLRTTFAGNPVIWAGVLDKIGWFLLWIPPVVVLLLLLIFYASLGDRRLVILSILPAILGSIWTFGVIWGAGMKADIVLVLVPIFVIVMGSAYGLHFVTHYQDHARGIADMEERVALTLRQIGVPIILTTATTVAGFGSLVLTDVRPMRQMGGIVSLGIVFAAVASFFVLPAVLTQLHVEPGEKKAPAGPMLTFALRALARRRWIAAAFALPLIVFAAVFIPRLRVNADPLFIFKEGDPVRVAFQRMTETFGGAIPLQGEFALDRKSDLGTQFAHIRELERQMEKLPGVRKVFSLADAAEALSPEDWPMLVEEGDTPLGRMVAGDAMRFVLFPAAHASEDVQGWLKFARDHGEVRALTGMPVLFDAVSRIVLKSQAVSLIAALIMVALLLYAFYRRFWTTLVAMVPITLTTGVLLAFVAASGIQLHLVTAIIGSIVIGVGIDYAIHLVAAIDYARPQGDGYVLRAIDSAGRPILANALGIAAGMSGLWLSPFRIHGHISMIMWVTMICAALAALLIIPAFSRAEGLRERSES